MVEEDERKVLSSTAILRCLCKAKGEGGRKKQHFRSFNNLKGQGFTHPETQQRVRTTKGWKQTKLLIGFPGNPNARIYLYLLVSGFPGLVQT